jgi:hypoxanthine phosphoribosyltransferase
LTRQKAGDSRGGGEQHARMPDPATAAANSRANPVVSLEDLPRLADDLAARVQAAGFSPQAIVYVETGARLLAHELAGRLSAPMIPIWVRRGGHGLKKKLAALAGCLPVAVRDWLRRVEERSGIHRLTKRAAALPDGAELRNRRVLLVDDAADTGRTVETARALLLAAGVAPHDLRTAVLAATTPRGRERVDFFVLDRNCRMPWSADSDELAEANARAARLAPSHAPRGF